MFSLRSPRTAGAVVASAVAVLALGFTAPAAHADALSTSGGCIYQGTSNGFTGAFDCTLNIYGGTPPYTVTYTGTNATFSPTSSTGYDTNVYTWGQCGVGGNTTWTATVRDATGATTSRGGGFYCSTMVPR